MVYRFDRGTLDAASVALGTGWLDVRARLTRVGVFTYQRADGSVQRELRLPDEVFSSKALATFDLAPVTDDHPPTLLTSDNTKTYQVGVVSTPKKDGDFVSATMRLTHKDAIEAVNRGKRELSCGYQCDLEFKPGIWNGHKYDAIQRNIVGNHVAIVDRGRAGYDARIRFDADNVGYQQEGKGMKTITLGGKTYEVEDDLAEAIAKEMAMLEAKAESKMDFESAVNMRVDALVVAKTLCPKEDLTKKPLKEIHLACLKAKYPATDFDKKSDLMIGARFDVLKEMLTDAPQAETETTTTTEHKDIANYDALYAESCKRYNDLWKQTPVGSTAMERK